MDRLPWPSRVFVALLKPLLQVLFRVEITGPVQVFRNERTLIVANHESLIDGLLLALFLPLKPTFVVHTEVLRSRFFRAILSFGKYLAVDSTSPLAIKQICRLVESGEPVMIFPEGRLTNTGSLMKVYDGAGFVAARTSATVVPVRIDGAGRSYFGRLAGIYPRHLLPKVRITILDHRTVAMPTAGTAKEKRRRAGEVVRDILTEMLVSTRPRQTVYQAFLSARDAFGRNYRLVEDVRLKEETYGSLLKMSLGVARIVRGLSHPQDNVGVLLPNAAPALGVILGLSLSNRRPAMLNYTAGPEGLKAACEVARITCILTSRQFLEKGNLTPVLGALPPSVTVHYLEDLKARVGLADKLWIATRLLAPRWAEQPQHPQDPALILFTSGSEGKPKGVVHTHDSLLSNVAQVRAISDFNPLDKFMIALPLFHSFGMLAGVMLPLVSGVKVFLYPSPLHYRIIPELVYDRNCTVLFGTSTFLANYGKFAHPYDFGRLRYVVAGAERLSDPVRKLWIEKFGTRILEGYGVTECAPVIACNVPMACRIGSVGKLVPGLEHSLEPVPGIETGGILHVRGPNVMAGYLLHDAPGQIKPPHSINSGWHSTGDIVQIDDEGYVHIRGRLKRFAKIAGEMVSLESVERIAAEATAPLLTTHKDFAFAASTRASESKGEEIVLLITEPLVTREELVKTAKRLGLPELAVPRVIACVEAIPLLGTGKTDYVRVKQLAEALQAPASGPEGDSDEAPPEGGPGNDGQDPGTGTNQTTSPQNDPGQIPGEHV